MEGQRPQSVLGAVMWDILQVLVGTVVASLLIAGILVYLRVLRSYQVRDDVFLWIVGTSIVSAYGPLSIALVWKAGRRVAITLAWLCLAGWLVTVVIALALKAADAAAAVRSLCFSGMSMVLGPVDWLELFVPALAGALVGGLIASWGFAKAFPTARWRPRAVAVLSYGLLFATGTVYYDAYRFVYHPFFPWLWQRAIYDSFGRALVYEMQRNALVALSIALFCKLLLVSLRGREESGQRGGEPSTLDG